MQDQKAHEMPIAVRRFKKLTVLSVLLGFPILMLDGDRIQRQLLNERGIFISPNLMISTLVLSIALAILLVWLIADKRQGWARIIPATLLPLSTLLALVTWPQMLQNSVAAVALSVLQVVMQFFSIVLVYSSDARPWFKPNS